MSNLSRRDPQTKVKHEILEEYLKRWSNIIARGLEPRYKQFARQGKPFNVRFVYVDCFSFIGRYAGEKGEVWTAGSPLIGISVILPRFSGQSVFRSSVVQMQPG